MSTDRTVLLEVFEFVNEVSAKCAVSLPNHLEECKRRTKEDFGAIVGLIPKLTGFAVSQLHSLLEYYRQSLANVDEYDDEDRAEFYLSITSALVDDIQGYINQREGMIKKKNQETLDRGYEKVASQPPSFLVQQTLFRAYHHGRIYERRN